MANRFLVAGGSGLWNNNNNWAATSGAASGASFPVAGDVVAIDSLSGNAPITVNVASACASFIVSGTYTGTVTFNSTLTLTSTCTFIAGMTIAGTAGTLIGTGTSTWTSGGKTLTCGLTLQGAVTFTLGDNWTVNGLVTLGTGTSTTTINSNTLNCVAGLTQSGTTNVITGTTLIKLTGTGTWTGPSTGGSIQTALTIQAGAGTITFAGAVGARWAGTTLTYTSGTLASGGLLVLGTNTTSVTGFSGTTASTGQLQCDVTISSTNTFPLGTDFNTTGTLTIAAGFCTFSGAHNINCGGFAISGAASGTTTLSGNITATGAMTLSNTTFTTFSGNFPIQAASMTLSGTQDLTLAAGQTITITGTTTIADACAIVVTSGSVFNTGGLTTTGALTGTQRITFNGTGTWSGASSCSNNVTINTSGTLTLSGTILYAASGTPTLVYTAGTVSAGTSILSIGSACTLNTNGMTWANVKLTSAMTLTLSSLLTVSDTFTLPDANVTFAPTGGFTVGTLTNVGISAARTYTMASGITYTINTAFTVAGSSSGHASFICSVGAGTKANMPLDVAATQALVYVDATDIDSSAGQTVNTLFGTLTRTVNWNTFSSFIGGGAPAIGYAA